MVKPDELKSSTLIGVDGRRILNPSGEPPEIPKPVIDINESKLKNTQKEKAPNLGTKPKPQV